MHFMNEDIHQTLTIGKILGSRLRKILIKVVKK